MRAYMLIVGFVLIVFVLTGCAHVEKRLELKGMPPDAPVERIHVIARKYAFEPFEIRVKRGTHLILDVESVDIAHEIEIEEYGIDVDVPAKKTVTVEIYASKPGRFEFSCHKGLGLHYKWGMKGTLVVE